MLSTLSKIFNRQHTEFFFFLFSPENRIGQYQILYLGKTEKNITHLLSADIAKRVAKVKDKGFATLKT